MKFNGSADTALWTKHYLDMAAGKIDSGRKYQLGSTSGNIGNGFFVVEQSGGGSGIHTRRPVVNVISPVAQGVEQAKASIKRTIKRRGTNKRVSSQKRRQTKRTKKKQVKKRSAKPTNKKRRTRKTKTARKSTAKKQKRPRKRQALDVFH